MLFGKWYGRELLFLKPKKAYSSAVKRLLYPDLLRSLAIAMMIVFHGAYDLSVYYGYDIRVFEGGWLVMGRIAALLFLGLAGVSSALSLNRAFTPWKKTLKRAGRILLAALVVTVVTYVIDPGTYVRFGVLHLIGVTVLALPLLNPLKGWNIVIGMIIALLGLVALPALPAWLGIPLGAPQPGFISVDYYPLLPWAGAIIGGYGLGIALMPWIAKSTSLEESHPALKAASYPGRHSLIIYLLHQPVMIIFFKILF